MEELKFVYIAMCSLVSQAGMAELYKVESMFPLLAISDLYPTGDLVLGCGILKED